MKVIRTLYMSLVLPKLEYASLIWAPNFRNHIERIETLNKRFLKFMCWKQDGFYPPRGCNVTDLASRFDLLTLEERREVTAIIFVVKLLRGYIDCPQFLELLPIRVPHANARLQVPFYLPPAASSSSFKTGCPLFRACKATNELMRFRVGTLDLLASPMAEIVRACYDFVKSKRVSLIPS